MTTAGQPAATENGGISLVTTELAPMIAPSPILTPERMVALSPIHTLSEITMGPFENRGRLLGGCRSDLYSERPWILSDIVTQRPVSTLFPIIILLIHVISG